jgi:prepilin-type N-terminal cleavage/methylation domain-containing protein
MKHIKMKGFTLVEIMIVVLIIGILMAIAVPNFVRARETSRVNSCIATLKEIDGAKEQWAMDQHKNQGDPVLMTDIYAAGGGSYLKVNPVCPSGGTYTVNAVGTPPTCTVANHVLPA